jgi:hypothetical protein
MISKERKSAQRTTSCNYTQSVLKTFSSKILIQNLSHSPHNSKIDNDNIHDILMKFVSLYRSIISFTLSVTYESDSTKFQRLFPYSTNLNSKTVSFNITTRSAVTNEIAFLIKNVA